ncbi:MAG: FHA domain-containing protein [Planctomycetota bacterium]
MAKLRIKDEQGNERAHEFVDVVTTVGRASDNIIQIADKKASRHHFRIEKQDGKFKIVDMGSTNGFRLNGVNTRIETFLRPNDQIVLGQTIFTFEDADALPPVKEVAAPVSKDEIVSSDPVQNAHVVESAAGHTDGPKWALKALEGKNSGKIYELGVKVLTIGRHNSSTIQIIDEAASNYHAEINREPVGYVLTDLGSTNGTYVRHKNKTVFEKIIKTPLSVGMHIRIGKTLLEFENIGRPVEDEAMFGTIALDMDKLNEQLTKPRRRMPRSLFVASLLLVFICVVIAVVHFAPTRSNIQSPPISPIINKIVNANFDEGTDENGNPMGFGVQRGMPTIKVAVVPEADREAHLNCKNKLGLQIGKTGAKIASTSTIVETRESFAVDPGKVYEFSGWMKNDGDGLFGLRVTWIQGERQFADHPVVLKRTQEWKEKKILLTPPPWAERARAGVFVQGKEGAACFDSLAFIEKSGEKPQPPPTLKYGGIEIVFEGTKGAFSAESQGQRILEDGTLTLTDGQTESDLSSVSRPQLTQDTGKITYSGELYDFAFGETPNYKIQTQPGAAGVDLTVAVNAPNEAGSSSLLRFYVIGPAAQGDIEVSKGDGAVERLQSNAEKQFTSVQEVLFNAIKEPKFALSFLKPVDIDLKREGSRRRVTIKFSGELRVALAPESLSQKQELLTAIAALSKSIQERRWTEVETQSNKLKTGYASRYSQAQEAVDKATQKLKVAWTDVNVEIDRTITQLKIAPTPENVDAAKGVVNRHLLVWISSEKEPQLRDTLTLIDAIGKTHDTLAAEKNAMTALDEAKKYCKPNSWQVAIALIKSKILSEGSGLSKTKAAEEARKILQQAENSCQREEDINRITDRLLTKVKPFVLANDLQSAINAITKDKEYQDNHKDLPEVNKKLDDLRKKAAKQL